MTVFLTTQFDLHFGFVHRTSCLATVYEIKLQNRLAGCHDGRRIASASAILPSSRRTHVWHFSEDLLEVVDGLEEQPCLISCAAGRQGDCVRRLDGVDEAKRKEIKKRFD